MPARVAGWLRAQLGRLHTRLLLVNLVVVLVPAAGLEFARIYERQLLNALERDMHNQAVLVGEMVAHTLDSGGGLDEDHHEQLLRHAAKRTRTRIRLLDTHGQAVSDSHRYGPPEGREPPAPKMLPDIASQPLARAAWSGTRWAQVPDRREVRSALTGRQDSYTRIRSSDPAVLLFHAMPIRHQGRVAGAVYVTRSTQPVMVELYRIRSGLLKVLLVALGFTALLTLLLAWSISRPLSRLVRAARRITAGTRLSIDAMEVPVGGSGEVRELGEAFATMTRKLDERLRYITAFAADVTHELKSPLTSIRGAAELLSEGAADEPEARERFLRNILLDVDRMDRLVSRLLELSRIEATTEPLAPMDVDMLIERVIERTHTPEQPVVRVPAEPSPRSPQQTSAIAAWPGRAADIERALLNLVENALRFSPAGEPVCISVTVDPAALHIAVHDRGPGVPPGERARIFERFYTTDAERSGTGLGLAIVAGVARSHGGDITLDTPAFNAPSEQPDDAPAAGPGSTFTLHLPRPRHR